MRRRGFLGRFGAAVAAGLIAWRPSSVFANGWRRTNQYHPDLKEFGIGFYLCPDELLDAEKFHLSCESMRASMVAALQKLGPVNLWRIGEVNSDYDGKSGEFVTTMRVRAANTERLDWKMPAGGMIAPGSVRVIQLEPKEEGAVYTFFDRN